MTLEARCPLRACVRARCPCVCALACMCVCGARGPGCVAAFGPRGSSNPARARSPGSLLLCPTGSLLLCPTGSLLLCPTGSLLLCPTGSLLLCSASLGTPTTPTCGHPWLPSTRRGRCCPPQPPAHRTHAPTCVAALPRRSSPSRSRASRMLRRRSCSCAHRPRRRSSRRTCSIRTRPPMGWAALPAARRVDRLCLLRARLHGRPRRASGHRRG